MQNTPSIWTTLGLIVIDGAQMVASSHDVRKVVKRMEIVKNRVNTEHIRLLLASSVGREAPEFCQSTILGYAQDILLRHDLTQTAQVTVGASRAKGPLSTEVVPFNSTMKPNKEVLQQLEKSPSVLLRPRLNPKFSLRKVISWPEANAEHSANVTQLELQYTLNVRKFYTSRNL
ncbi:unnamed protein product [Phytophthora fragariaefolia]|uniref:Unnamed protein product n=1 Tax=Phytophthora fragariaefolia TaxID=1490495 RepID=A0A9W6XF03_9STRA|nr:unnamed protein product [Phytophthora fragariaefolia]